ncbi:MAG: DUF4160 domain-containing protein [Acidobacteria bacterium]|nr:DUF4160 domain-containing protein [Acidobacteriota bacterium]MBI3282017.1 DUF4160 domain-containing protein [Acidobacteriota bacterium]
MPTVLLVEGWRVHFHTNEADEAMHVHACKGEAECKFWLHPDQFVIEEDYEHSLKPGARREIRRILYEHFDYVCEAWHLQFGRFRAR